MSARPCKALQVRPEPVRGEPLGGSPQRQDPDLLTNIRKGLKGSSLFRRGVSEKRRSFINRDQVERLFDVLSLVVGVSVVGRRPRRQRRRFGRDERRRRQAGNRRRRDRIRRRRRRSRRRQTQQFRPAPVRPRDHRIILTLSTRRIRRNSSGIIRSAVLPDVRIRNRARVNFMKLLFLRC